MKRLHTLLAALLLLASVLPAQVVRFANHSGVPFEGWWRTVVDQLPPHPSGRVGDTHYVVGRRTGLDTYAVDVRVRLAAGEHLSLDLSTATSLQWLRPPLPANPLQHFGGPCTIAGQSMAIIALKADGAGYTVHLRARVGRMLNVDHWIQWYPDQAWSQGEVVVTASNPNVTDIDVLVPAGFELRFGDGLGLVLGRGVGPLIDAGTKFVDGQARGLPITWVFLRHLQTASSWSSVGAAVNRGIGAVGIARLLPQGNPHYAAGFDGLAWARQRLPEAVRRLHTWEPPICGPAATATQSGDQEDQVFTRGEALLPNGVGAEIVTWLSGLKLMARPNHHLEADGRQIVPSLHPNLVIWSGRAHWHTVVSPDQLGKLEQVGPDHTLPYKWFGHDREHALIALVAAASRYTGSHALQWEMSSWARLFLLQMTIPSMKPGWSSNGFDAPRAIGWMGLVAMQLHENLEDRALATLVVDRWRKWVLEVCIPQAGGKPGNIWQTWNDAPNVVPGQVGWQHWSQALGAGLLDMACERIGPPQGRELARLGALACLEHGWIKKDGVWRELANVRWTHVGKDANAPYTAVPGTEYDSGDLGVRWYYSTWCVPAIATVLRHDPANVRARAIWDQVHASLEAEGPNARWSWVPPMQEAQ